jgi:ABC-type branched-subunit amino acid transport system ATPase component/ABC-type branched-subunit amino acid transport system permease subunit
MLAAIWTKQLLFDGAVNGAVIGLFAIGIVLVYRSTRVINFAVANMGLLASSLLSLLVIQYGAPFWVAVLVCLLAGTLSGLAVELSIIRRLFRAPRVIVLIATIGIAQLFQAATTGLPKLDDVSTKFPTPIGKTWPDVFGVSVAGPQLTILVVVPIIMVALTWFLNRTVLGQTVKASAENPDLARLSAISPKFASSLVWALAGLVASLSMLLLGGTAGSATSAGNLGPSTMARALAAAVIAGMVSFPRALLAGVAIGVLEALFRFNFLDVPSLTEAFVFISVLVAVWFQSRRGSETVTFSFAPRTQPIPANLRDVWWVRHLGALTMGVVGALGVGLPFLVTQPSRILLYGTVLLFAMAAVSVSVLTGWTGQLSLSQMAFAGLGALFAAALHRGASLNIGWRATRVLRGSLPPLSFPVSIVLAAIIVGALAALIGLGSLRVRGLLLAVSTFAFGLAAQQYLYPRPFFTGGAIASVPFGREPILGIDLTSQRSYYLLILGVLAVVIVLVSRLRRSGIGRTTIAVRDNENTAAAYTVGPIGVKLRAFALSGMIAALAGGLLGGLVENVPVGTRLFTVGDSLQVVAIAVIGGLGTVAGPLLGALWVVGLPAFFPNNDVVPLLSSSLGLLILLMYLPGGMMQVVYAVRDAFLARVAARRPSASVVERPAASAVVRGRAPRPAPEGGSPWLATSGLSVMYGGVKAVDDVDLVVGPREVVGLIGTNGAGKSSLMGAIGGFVPAQGRVHLFGDDLSNVAPNQRAQRGLGRTFQAATLFPELTVRETVLVALEARGRTGMISTALALPRSVGRERSRRAEADELITFLGLGRYGDVFISDLSTGTRRIVELAGLLALDARVLCLDEPTAGVAQRETEAFGPLVVEMARELDASVLIIEHDIPLIMSISQRVYCLELGATIAEGAPDDVRSDPRVIASYLGLDERAIARSGTAAAL